MISPASAAAVEAAGTLASAYVHVPFCARVCPYCDFTVVAGRDDVIDRYVDVVGVDIDTSQPWRILDAVFVGGGTPSRIGAARLGKILERLASRHGIAGDAEVTLEANPEDVRGDAAAEFVAVGFTRISLGVQSFDDRVLADLGREHRSETARSAIEAALEAGFRSVSVDLIFGSPVETDASWEMTLAAAVEAAPHHVSTYSLTVEPGTVLWRQVRGGSPAPDADVQADRWETAEAVLTAAGYERYEVSNHARPGHHCRYNAAVWAQAEYLAYGVGAHGYRGGVRTANVRRLDTYLDRVERGIGPVQTSERNEGWAAELERLMLGLRRAGGVTAGRGGSALLASAEGRRLRELGVLAAEGDRIVVTRPLLTDAVARAVLDLEPPNG